ncbi:uncharacterized protein LOC103574569 isoform X1 [Microplitis demolitor]|uniref:uncharacterized protein LOC103574569 isoform X1 n=1 Tax=Microplitis demolitor TaxID=69319 RepID=UPI0004CD48B5|nr:uncharacterized protein LOC103574569 isoform X1 [Microplitis demolitor]
MKYCSFFMILIVSIILPSKNESEGFILRDWLYNCLMNRKMTTTSTISTSNSLTGTTISPKIAAFRIRNSVAPFTPSTTNDDDSDDVYVYYDHLDSDYGSSDESDDDRGL